jgi:Ser/Thr protein kinase RdoA (MazF antagonist)
VRAGPHLVWLATWVNGSPIASLSSPSAPLLENVGRALATLDDRLAGFDDPALHRTFRWDLPRAAEIMPLTGNIADSSGRDWVRRRLRRFQAEVVPRLAGLPRQVVHNDANDHNLLVRKLPGSTEEEYRASGLLDFGDLVWTVRVAEPAIAAAYAMLGSDRPVEAAASLLAGYRSVCAMTTEEASLIPDLIEARLCVSVTISAYERARAPDNAFVSVSEAPAWRLLRELAGDTGSLLASTCAELA